MVDAPLDEDSDAAEDSEAAEDVDAAEDSEAPVVVAPAAPYWVELPVTVVKVDPSLVTTPDSATVEMAEEDPVAVAPPAPPTTY